MSLFNQLKCLETKGLITDAQKNRISQIAAGLPSSDGDLLRFIAALSLINVDDDNILGESPIGVQSITSTGTSDVKSLTVPAGATRAIISVHENNIIFRTDGGTPAADVGHISEVGRNFIVGAISSFKFVASAADSVIFVSYF